MRQAILFEFRLLPGQVDDNEGDTDKEARKYERVEVGVVTFHEFGTNYDMRDKCVGQFSSAIIELRDGTLENVPVESLQFIRDDVTLN